MGQGQTGIQARPRLFRSRNMLLQPDAHVVFVAEVWLDFQSGRGANHDHTLFIDSVQRLLKVRPFQEHCPARGASKPSMQFG